MYKECGGANRDPPTDCKARYDPNTNLKKYSYDFTFTDGSRVFGTSDSNTVDVTVAGKTFPLHISCSDSFEGGYGEKDGPVRGQNPAVSTWTVWKYKNLDKSDCRLEKMCGDTPAPPSPSPSPTPSVCVPDTDDPNTDLKQYSYDFTFVDGTRVFGTSDSNTVTVSVDGDAFPLHISCSDTFKNGYGSKGGPVEGVNPAVAKWDVWKYSNPDKADCRVTKRCGGDFVCQPAPNCCPAGFEDGFFDNKCYDIVTTPMTWEKAAASCKKRGGRLAFLSDKDTLDWIDAHFGTAYREWWVGYGRDRDEDDDWAWTGTTSKGRVVWDLNEPDDDGDCAVLYRGSALRDDCCNRQLPFICQIDAPPDCLPRVPQVYKVEFTQLNVCGADSCYQEVFPGVGRSTDTCATTYSLSTSATSSDSSSDEGSGSTISAAVVGLLAACVVLLAIVVVLVVVVFMRSKPNDPEAPRRESAIRRLGSAVKGYDEVEEAAPTAPRKRDTHNFQMLDGLDDREVSVFQGNSPMHRGRRQQQI